MTELELILAVLYSLPVIPTTRRIAWSYADGHRRVPTAEAVWIIFWSIIGGIVWPLTLPINILHESQTSGKDFVMNTFGTAPKHIRKESKMKKLEARNKELERQLNL